MSLRSPKAVMLVTLALFTASVDSIASDPLGSSALAAAVPGALAFALMIGAATLLLHQFLRRGGSRLLALALTELCCALLAAGGAATEATWAWTWIAGQLLLPAGLALALWGGPDQLRRRLASAGLRREAVAGAAGAVALAAVLLLAAIALPHRADPSELGRALGLGVGAIALATLAVVVRRARRSDIERWIVVCAALCTSATILGLIASERGSAAWWASRAETVLAAFAMVVALWGEYRRLYRKLTRAAERLRPGAGIDPVTGTLNREAVLEQGAALLPGVGRDRAPLTVAVVELDDFAVLLTRHGVLTGDRILAEVARRISGALRDYDVVGRLGQGSFLLLLPDADVLGGRHALERVVASVRSRPISAVHASIAVRISVGVVQAEAGRVDLDDAIEHAYLALGTARAQGSEDALTRAANLTALPSAAPPPEAHESHAA